MGKHVQVPQHVGRPHQCSRTIMVGDGVDDDLKPNYCKARLGGFLDQSLFSLEDDVIEHTVRSEYAPVL